METRGNNYAFIDSQNVNLSIRRLGWNLDWRRFRVYLHEKHAVTKAYLFIGYVEGNNDLWLPKIVSGLAQMPRWAILASG
jgi:hypothetical protein